MSVATQRGAGGGGYVERAPGGGSSSLADVVALILDKGKTSGVLEAAAEKVNDVLASSREQRGEEVRRRPVRQRARENEE